LVYAILRYKKQIVKEVKMAKVAVTKQDGTRVGSIEISGRLPDFIILDEGNMLLQRYGLVNDYRYVIEECTIQMGSDAFTTEV
jgi:hypothetical protein